MRTCVLAAAVLAAGCGGKDLVTVKGVVGFGGDVAAPIAKQLVEELVR